MSQHNAEHANTDNELEPPLARSLDKLLLLFHDQHHAYLERTARSKLGHKADPTDFANRVLLKFHHSYSTDRSFREFVHAEGIAAIRRHGFWSKWIRWTAGNLFREYYEQLPKITSRIQNTFLQLAAARPDGFLFPLISHPRRNEEDRLLKKLLADKAVREVSTSDVEPVWRHDSVAGHITLKTTDSGDRRLEDLIKLGLMEKLLPLEKLLIWRHEDQTPVTLKATRNAQDYVDNLSSGANSLPFDEERYPVDENEYDYEGLEDHIDDVQFRAWANPARFAQVIRHLESEGWIDPRDCEIYLARKSGLRLVEVAVTFGVSKSTVQRIEKTIDKVFEIPEAQRLILARFPLKETSRLKQTRRAARIEGNENV